MIDDAGRHPALWRLLMGILTVFAVLALWMIGLGGAWSYLSATGTGMASVDIGTPEGTALYLLLVAGLGVGTLVAGRFWQKRGPGSLIGPAPRTLHDAVLSALVAVLVLGGLFGIGLPFSGLPESNRALGEWLVWLPAALVVLALQSGGEEIFFRGYLQSQLAARFRLRIVSMGLPALLFGLAHYLPTLPTAAALLYVGVTVLFGLLAADLTMRTGSIGAAWGFHAANNAMIILFIAPEGSVSGLALWKTGTEFGDDLLTIPVVLMQMAMLVGIWFGIRRVLRV